MCIDECLFKTLAHAPKGVKNMVKDDKYRYESKSKGEKVQIISLNLKLSFQLHDEGCKVTSSKIQL